MKLKFELELDTNNQQDTEELKALVEKLEELLLLIEESRD
jgi:hypothetical protein